jgi:hypothetical protein
VTGIRVGRRFALAIIGWAAAGLSMTLPTLASGPGFQGAQADAYAHYREAVFYARTGNTPVAGLALDEFVTKWTALVGLYADNPPPEYAGDAKFGETLRDILARSEEGLEALDADDAESAREAINPIRGILADLRRRNGLVTWSDLVDELTAAMDVLARYRREVKDLDDAETVAMVRDQAAIVAALFERCRKEAAPEIAVDPEFRRLISGAAESMGRLLESLETKSMRLYRIGIGELRSYERIMYLRFG